MAHLENASLTNRAVMCSRRLEVVAGGALSIPKSFQIGYGLCPIFHQSFDIFLKTFKSVVLLDGVVDCSVVVHGHLGGFSAFSVLYLKPESLVGLEVLWTAGLNQHGPKVVKHDIVQK